MILSNNAEGPLAGGETTVSVVGSNTVSGIGSLRRLPLMSVPNGNGLAGVAEEVLESGSEIWYSVISFSFTTRSANENTLALNRAVIFVPLPAVGKKFVMAVLVRCVSSHEFGPFG